MVRYLSPGDVFCTRNPMLLGRIINAVQAFNSVDGKSIYSHAGFILDPAGETFEALWKNKRQNLFEAYAGKQVLIGRHKNMNTNAFIRGWNGVSHHEGKIYAGHRLLFFLIPPLAKYINTGLGVCSELTAKFLYRADLLSYWKGVSPDTLADIVANWRQFDIIFEGQLPPTLTDFIM